jgi:predicted nucleic acid-binding protein
MRRFIRRKTRLVKPKRTIKACRDPDDAYLLEVAVGGKAEIHLQISDRNGQRTVSIKTEIE